MLIEIGFPHSDIPGSKLAWELPEAYRTLPRPSSSFSVKAFTVRPYLKLRTTKTLNCASLILLPFICLLTYWICWAYFSTMLILFDKLSTYTRFDLYYHFRSSKKSFWLLKNRLLHLKCHSCESRNLVLNRELKRTARKRLSNFENSEFIWMCRLD